MNHLLNKKMIKDFIKIDSLFLLIPIFIISGGFLSGVLISLITLFFLINIRNYNLNFSFFFLNKINLIFIFILVYLIFHSLLSNYKYESFSSTLFYFRYYLFVLAIFFCITFDDIFFKKFFYIMATIFIILFIDSIIQYMFQKNIFLFPIQQPGRINSFFRDELILGSYIARFFPLLLALLFMQNYNKSKEKIVVCLFMILSLITIILSGERNAIILFFLSVFLFMLLIKDFRILFLSLLFGSFLIFFLFYQLNFEFQKRMFEIYNIIFNSESLIHLTYFNIYFSSLSVIKSNFIFGVGTGLFELHCKEITTNPECMGHPHNI